MSDNTTIGQRIKAIRKEKQLTQQAVADATSVSRSAVAQIEQDTFGPGWEFIRDFVSLTNTTYEYIMDGKDSGKDYGKVSEDLPLNMVAEPNVAYNVKNKTIDTLVETIASQQETINQLSKKIKG
jgi:transcriptional regulator with XRE-family HTH domain